MMRVEGKKAEGNRGKKEREDVREPQRQLTGIHFLGAVRDIEWGVDGKGTIMFHFLQTGIKI